MLPSVPRRLTAVLAVALLFALAPTVVHAAPTIESTPPADRTPEDDGDGPTPLDDSAPATPRPIPSPPTPTQLENLAPASSETAVETAGEAAGTLMTAALLAIPFLAIVTAVAVWLRRRVTYPR